MLETILGVALIFFGISQSAVIEDHPQGYVYYEHPEKLAPQEERGIIVKPVDLCHFHLYKNT